MRVRLIGEFDGVCEVKRILILAALDTKGVEARYLRDVLMERGAETLLMDLSMRLVEGDSGADIPAEDVARSGGGTLGHISDSKQMAVNMEIMISGALKRAYGMVKDGRVHGVMAIGGYTGTYMATAVMQGLPFGLPKVMVSSAAALPGLCNRFLSTSDILLFHSVIEISGLSGPVKNVLQRAAFAAAAMVTGPAVASPITDRDRALAMTMLNTCERCARRVRTSLIDQGYQVIGFHAAGIGDRVMEEMIGKGDFSGVIDLAPGGVGEHLYGYARDAGPDRLESAGRVGVPQIISTCGVNHVSPLKSRYKPEHRERRRYDLDRFRTWLRMSPEELREVASLFAEKLNRSLGPVKIVVPLKGWSSVDSPGGPTYDPEEDALFIRALEGRLKKEIEIIRVPANMEDPEFADTVIRVAEEIFRRKEA